MSCADKPKVLFVIAKECFRDEEYAVPFAHLKNAGFDTYTASLEKGQCKGRFGLIATADLDLHEALQSNWDAVVFVGGGGAECYFDSTNAHQLAIRCSKTGKAVAAICIAPGILARAGLLKGVRACAYPSEKGALINNGAIWCDSSVVVDQISSAGCYIITANGPEAADEFARRINECLL